MNVSMSSTVENESNKMHDISNSVYGIYFVLLFCYVLYAFGVHATYYFSTYHRLLAISPVISCNIKIQSTL